VQAWRNPWFGPVASVAVACAVAAPALAQDAPDLRTRAERTGYVETSRYTDVVATLEAIAVTTNAIVIDTFGYSLEGRALPVATWGEGPTRALVFANIHAGEVAGKEAALILLRDLAAGLHDAWRDRLTLAVAPIYNADGNERIALTNRPLQHGPIGGMGQRPNALGLDLNRDFVKLESPEARSLVDLIDRFDPHVVVDLHTTNGTIHAYHLTYAPPLHPNTDPAIDRFARETWLPEVTRALAEGPGSWLVYHYGNLPDAGVDGADDPTESTGWYTYSPKPRFSTNYVGLRNRFGILSEAYAYLSFEERVAVSLRFVEEVLDVAAERGEEIRRIAEAADGRRIVGDTLAVRAAEHRLVDEDSEILLGAVDTVPHPWTGRPLLRRRDETRPRADARVLGLPPDGGRAGAGGVPRPAVVHARARPPPGPRDRDPAPGGRACSRRRGVPDRRIDSRRARVPGPPPAHARGRVGAGPPRRGRRHGRRPDGPAPGAARVRPP